jgi:hypothetical protein
MLAICSRQHGKRVSDIGMLRSDEELVAERNALCVS